LPLLPLPLLLLLLPSTQGVWVTDEFESEAYEMGNMEAIHGTYLWDK